MSEQDAGGYELADVPEEPRKAMPQGPPAKPLPRLWKTDPDDDEADEVESKARKEEPPPEVRKPVGSSDIQKRPKTGATKDGKSGVV
jgi:hypothetical protein